MVWPFRKLKPLPLSEMALNDIYTKLDKLADDLDSLNRTDAVVAHLDTIGDARLRAEAKRDAALKDLTVRLRQLEAAAHVHLPRFRAKSRRKKKS